MLTRKLALAAAALLLATPALAEPPPFAPAHGWRAKQAQHHPHPHWHKQPRRVVIVPVPVVLAPRLVAVHPSSGYSVQTRYQDPHTGLSFSVRVSGPL
jgi:hypothetical protein